MNACFGDVGGPNPNFGMEPACFARGSCPRSADKVDEDREAEDYPDEAS